MAKNQTKVTEKPKGKTYQSQLLTFAAGLILGPGLLALCYHLLDISADEGESDVFWSCAPLLVLDAVYVFVCLKLSGPVALMLLEDESKDMQLKHGVRNSWTNAGVVAALVASIGAAAWQLDPPADQYDLPSHMFGLWAVNSTAFAIVATLMPVMCLVLTDYLSEIAFIDFIRFNKNQLAYPYMFMAYSLFSLVMALIVRDYSMYGRAHALVSASVCLGCLFMLGYTCVNLVAWSNVVDSGLQDSAGGAGSLDQGLRAMERQEMVSEGLEVAEAFIASDSIRESVQDVEDAVIHDVKAVTDKIRASSLLEELREEMPETDQGERLEATFTSCKSRNRMVRKPKKSTTTPSSPDCAPAADMGGGFQS